MNTKSIRMVSLTKGYFTHREEIDAAYHRVMESGWYILGEEVRRFEADFANWCGAKACIGVGNGTDAIALCLRSLAVGPGDAVFTVSHTAVATVAAIEMTGASAVLVDIEPEYFTMDANSLERAVQNVKGSSRPRAVIAVHIYGQACDLTAIRAVCDARGLYLIEDCAQAFGATYKGRAVGSIGHVGGCSFNVYKTITSGDGGNR